MTRDSTLGYSEAINGRYFLLNGDYFVGFTLILDGGL